MPLDAWTRTESWRKKDDVVTAQEQERDELRELMAALTLSPQVAGVSYPRGCRIRRVRVTGAKPDPRGDQTVIVSRRALEEARSGGALTRVATGSADPGPTVLEPFVAPGSSDPGVCDAD